MPTIESIFNEALELIDDPRYKMNNDGLKIIIKIEARTGKPYCFSLQKEIMDTPSLTKKILAPMQPIGFNF